jgi:hypothetical protein
MILFSRYEEEDKDIAIALKCKYKRMQILIM